MKLNNFCFIYFFFSLSALFFPLTGEKISPGAAALDLEREAMN